MKKIRRISAKLCIAFCFMLLALMLPFTCLASESQTKTIRVAYELVPGYQEGGAGEYKTGYGYEYLQKLAKINGWEYEYVYGTFDELLQKLEKGEVDIMGQLTYSEERAELISYGAYEQGKKGFYLYAKNNNTSIDQQDYSTLNEKKIGVCAGKIFEPKWVEWCKEQGIQCHLVRYDYFTDLVSALNSGEIDALIEGRVQLAEITADWNAVLKFTSEPFYFGVNKKRPDLLKQLNAAQNEILEENPFYNEKVQERYMDPVSSVSINLNNKEKNWIKENDGHIRFGYLEGFPPLCYTDENGICQGVAADVLSSIQQRFDESDIQVDAVVYADYHTMFEDLKRGKISAAWPAYDDYWSAAENGFTITDRVVDTTMMLVYDGKYTDDTVKKIGVINTGSLPKIYAKIHYPQSEILEYDSYESAINAVFQKEVSSVLYVSTTYNVDVLNNEDLQKLNMTTLPEAFGISFAVRQEDEALSSILDKEILAFGEAGVNHSLITNSVVNREIKLKDFFKQNPLMANLLVGIVVVLIAGMLLLFIYSKMSIRVKTSQREKEIYERISNSDPLTGLYNRQAVFHKCQELLKEHPDKRFVMAHVDMVHFRLFNTFFGDEEGDKLLCAAADLFRELAKEYDYYTYGRIEADVFCAFFPYEQKKYQKHMEFMQNKCSAYRSDFLIEPKVGIYFVTDPEMPIESMFTRASLAAKEVQPGTPYATVVYDEKMETELNEKQQIINEMQTAIDEEQFHVYLQPKYSLQTNQMVGAEALVRWMHPIKGMISPGVFIPVFESNGFITTLDRYMWEHVCQILSMWKKEGKPMVPISVNVSRLSMFGSTTVEFLKELIEKYEIDTEYLELELTESAYIDDPEEMKLQMHALKDAGFTILLDDFGSGYSSLNTLREIPVDVLKMDMKFLSLDQTDLRGGLVISSIIRMAKLLNLIVIAEGVEIQEQADYLKEVGCEYVQGFLFSRPVPVAEFEKLLIGGNKPLLHVNQPAIDHIGRILAETGSGTYAMGTVIPTPLACLEYADEEYRFLRVNPAFYAEFRTSKDAGPMFSGFKKHLTENSHHDFIQALKDSVKREKEIRVPILWNAAYGKQREYICSVVYEGNIGKTAMLVVTFNNITDMMHRGTNETQMKHSLEIENRLWDCVKKLVTANNISTATNSILHDVLYYYHADRAYMFEFDWKRYICTNTYEICAPGVIPAIDTLQEAPLGIMEIWIKLFNEKSLLQIRDINELIGDETRKDEYDVLAAQDIESLIAVPVYSDEKLVGFFGVDNPKSNLDDISFIESLAFFCVNESLREKEKTDLEKQSMIDPLTGAYNRKAWKQEQKKLIRKKIPFSVLMIDVDDYKKVNDQFGHQIGDEVLKKIVTTLRKMFRANDMIVRYGGDEFLVILENTGSWMEEILTGKLDKINEILEQPDDQLPSISVSTGIAFSDQCDAEDLFRNADNALYHVKNSGKKGWHIYKRKNSKN